MNNPTIAAAAESFLAEIAGRNRRPARPSTLKSYNSQLRAHILPLVGSKLVSEFSLEDMRQFVNQLIEQELKPKSISCILTTLRSIIASIRDQNGLPLYPKNFTANLIDAPAVVFREQNTPTVLCQQIEDAIASRDGSEVLYAVLASTGLRIAEALATRINGSSKVTSWSSADACIHVRTQWTNGNDGPLKTENAVRCIPVPLPVNQFMIDQCPREGEFLFAVSQSTIRNRMERAKLPPPHAFRRFYAQTIARMPDGLQKYLMGHSVGTMHDKYNRQATDPDFRNSWRNQIEMGFELNYTKRGENQES
jgi:integrase